jgi:hypothetical protein
MPQRVQGKGFDCQERVATLRSGRSGYCSADVKGYDLYALAREVDVRAVSVMESTVSSAAKPQQGVVRGVGVTDAERFLARLARRSFLSLWSYPAVYRDQGVKASGDGKEVADLLVVFDNHIIIFSDKDCEFGDSGDLHKDWCRWYRKAVEASARQIWGAERWIRDYPTRLFMDRRCTKPLPVPLPPLSDARFHPVVVAHGVSARCRQHFGGGTGSLILRPDVVGDMHLRPFEEGGSPFTIGRVDPSRGFVHVLDDFSLETLLSTLDTLTDFVEYLARKERFIESGRLLSAAGEEELLAFYLKDVNAAGEHAFIVPVDVDRTTIAEGFWGTFINRPERRAQVEANQVSYLWDVLIESFSEHILNGTQHYTTAPGIEHSERIMRFLAREPRTRRRMLSKMLLDAIETTPKAYRRTIVVEPSRLGDPHYVFLLLPKPEVSDEEEYRTVRREMLFGCCLVTRSRYPQAKDIVGIATETGNDPDMERSEDSLYFDARNWSEDLEAEAKEIQEATGLLTTAAKRVGLEREYPLLPGQTDRSTDRSPYLRMKGRFRNAPCPCGSGRKFKKCCGAK